MEKERPAGLDSCPSLPFCLHPRLSALPDVLNRLSGTLPFMRKNVVNPVSPWKFWGKNPTPCTGQEKRIHWTRIFKYHITLIRVYMKKKIVSCSGQPLRGPWEHLPPHSHTLVQSPPPECGLDSLNCS